MATVRAAAFALLVSATASASAATYTVTSSAASGPGTLRQAILDANANPGGDAIRFTVAQATIEPSGLPPITDRVDIDGLLGDSSRVLIEMPGALDVVGGFRFHLGSFMSTLRNVVTGPIPNAALEIGVDVGDIVVENNRFGGNVEALGLQSLFEANTFTSPAFVVHITGPNNRFLRNSLPLVMLDASAFSNEIGQLPGTGNTIVRVTSSSNNLTVGYNTFTGSGGGPAIDIVSPPFPGGAIARNTISGYPVGIRIAGATDYQLVENVIVDTGIPIDLGGDGPTPNDPAPDADTGANTLQNYPVLTSAIRLQNSLTIRGTLTSTPLASYRIEIFAGSPGEPEARQYLGMMLASTEADGTATFVGSTDAPPDDDDVIAATATRLNDTSELSAAIPVLAPGLLSFSPETVVVHEAVGTATVTVIRSDGSEGTVTVRYSTFSGGASAPADYLATSGTLTFGPGVTTQAISIPIVDDDVPERDESFLVVLSNPTGGTAILGQDATVVIAAQLNAIPTLPVWGLIMLAASLAFLAVRRSA